MDSDDEPLTLSAATLVALQQFKQEDESRRQEFDKLFQQLEENFAGRRQFSIDQFKEDWQLSQFWYSDDTADTLALALLEGADENTIVCIASAPAVYAAVTRIPEDELPTKHIYLLDFDNRFQVMAGKNHFFHYNYNTPDKVPAELRSKCHRLLIDPPFLEPECQTKSAQAVRNLLVKDERQTTKTGDKLWKLVTCTGERMREIVAETYPETRPTLFLPQHKNGLSNEFRCYASFEGKYWSFDSTV
ncbi:hypothetical protein METBISCDRAFT_22187 [Metschnikowia bicuspidata]|uniref:Protein-lysine N-methyltransferase EFM5 n=1 Tax=Metschnikowia bicuspidata TaxID=27322 RepID=A0A4P9ZH28_9ASCO|nr:hypothetical protein METBISCDRAFT_22187 [Metschnikowia bicuspidata]